MPYFQPFFVTFHLCSPKILLGSPWLNFDGVIAHLVVRERLGENFWTLPSKDPMPDSVLYGDRVMPLKQTRQIYHASVGQFLGPFKVGVTTLYKRFDERSCHLIETDIKKINVGSGLFRAYMMKIPHVTTRTITFFVNGDLKEVLRLLQYLPMLGKKGADGAGDFRATFAEVKHPLDWDSNKSGICYGELPEDYSLVKDGKAMRPLPCWFRDGEERMMLAWKPPYWDKRNVAVCVPPGANITKPQS